MQAQPKAHPVLARAVDLGREPHAQQIQVHSPAELHPFSKALALWMKVLGYSPKDLFAVWLALEEAVVHAFLHGNHGGFGKRIFVRYLVTPDEVLLEVEDQGRGFDTDRVPDSLGRGLVLLRTYMTWVSFNPQGSCVTFARQRSHS
jgi:anti-sigma regulatory factor (Ser/Thr protein kinase)